MQKIRSRSLVGGFLVASIGVLLAPATPANAADGAVTITINGNAVARATWTDLTDTLCARTFSGYSATASLQRPDGTWVSITDNTIGDNAPTCTGNLSIQEDYYTTLRITYNYSGTTKTEMVYT